MKTNLAITLLIALIAATGFVLGWIWRSDHL